MKNKIELKRMIMCSIFVIIVMNILFAIISHYQYKMYTENFNKKIGQIISKIKDEYPNIEKNQLIQILNSEGEIDTALFREYGIEFEKEGLILENEKEFCEFLICNLFMITVLAIVILAIFLKYNRKKDKKLDEITKYIEDINHRNYRLDIDDNTEDELSILKNEIYKTTIMLKEMAENSKQDKIQLKDSLSDISHQLKTPLTSITIMLDNILDNPQMEINARNEFIKDIKREVINVNFLVNSLLKLSKLDANSIKFVNKEENVKEIIKESIKNVAMLCDLKNITINTTGDSESKIYCDLKWQIEAVTNVLKNAVEHSNINSKIEIYYEQNQVYTRIEIKDFGIGIAEADLPHIFERFYKGANSSNDSIGIGLALAKSIIEKNNGYIGVESESRKGTIFTIKYFK